MRSFLLFLSIILAGSLTSYSQHYTKHAEVSLLTCSPGTEELYAHFGHSAIRVQDTTTNTDVVYNYGVFDFDTPNFYWKFIKGKLKYQLALQPTYWFLNMYAREGRYVIEEKMILTQAEKMKLLEYLKWNRKPENRYYLYDFFYNNCSSKIWDVVKPQLNTDIEFDKSDYEPLTFRQMLHPLLERVEWALFGIDILLGIPSDIVADFEEQMFLPNYLSENMSHVKRAQKVKGSRYILGSNQVIIQERTKNESGFLAGTLFDSPKAMSWLLFFHILGFSLISGMKFKRWFDLIYFSILGLLGVFLLFMWFGTDHEAVNTNLNLLWASPLAVFFVILRIRRSFQWMNVFSVLLMVSSLVLLFGFKALPQQFHHAVIPLALLIPLRALDNIFIYQFKYTLSEKIRLMIGKPLKFM